jgi:hypothetical protein
MPIWFNKDPDAQIKKYEIDQLRKRKLPLRMQHETPNNRRMTKVEIEEEIDKIVRS